MKISKLCKMVEDSFRRGKYTLEKDDQRHLPTIVQL